MAFSSTGLSMRVNRGLNGGGPAIWTYTTSDPSTAVKATGYFAKMGAGSRGPVPTSTVVGPQGMKVGDILISQESTNGGTPGRTTLHTVTGSTADQSSTSASTGYAAAYDVTVSAATT